MAQVEDKVKEGWYIFEAFVHMKKISFNKDVFPLEHVRIEEEQNAHSLAKYSSSLNHLDGIVDQHR